MDDNIGRASLAENIDGLRSAEARAQNHNALPPPILSILRNYFIYQQLMPIGTNVRAGTFDAFLFRRVQSPRFEGRPMPVGPLSQVLIAYARGHKLTPEVGRCRAPPRHAYSRYACERPTAAHLLRIDTVHEIGIASSILECVQAEAERHPGCRVVTVGVNGQRWTEIRLVDAEPIPRPGGD